jgi:Calx-beta domain
VEADVPSDAPLGSYRFLDVAFTDSLGHTTTLLPGGGVLVDGAASSQSHTFNLVGTLDVVDEIAPTLHDLRWVDDRDWAVVGGDDAIAMDVHVSDNWRDGVFISVGFTEQGGGNGATLRGTMPAREAGAQDGWVRVTGSLGDIERHSATYHLSGVTLIDGYENTSWYSRDGTLVERRRWHLDVVGSHDVDLTRFALDVRDAVPSFHTWAPIADSTLEFGWSPAKEADGSSPDQYTVHLVPFELSGDPSSRPVQWQPSDVPERVISVPGDQTELVVGGLDNGRRYDARVVAHFAGHDVDSEVLPTIVWPSISYSPSVEVVEGDAGVTYAVVTARLSSPAMIDVDQHVSLNRITARNDDNDYLETYQGDGLTVPAGATSAKVKIPIVGDVRDEEDETFQLFRHYNHAEATKGDDRTIITILDDDPAPGAPLSIGSTEVLDVGAGTGPAILTVGLARAHRKVVTVEYRTRDGSAQAGTDYQAKGGTLRFKPGVISRTITIPVYGSSVSGDAAFRVRLRNAHGATISRASGTVTIQRP